VLTEILRPSIVEFWRVFDMTDIQPRLLNVDETARYLSIAAKTIRNRLGPKAPDPFPVKPKRIGKRVLFDVRDLDAYVDSLSS
jgi:hypothetical protein